MGRLRRPAKLLVGVCLVGFIAFVLLTVANLFLSPVPDDCDSPCGSSLGIILATVFACVGLAFLALVALTIAWTIVAWSTVLWRRARR
jgi:H+/Cl- antiporter ClcA